FLTAFKNLGRLRDPGKFKVWLAGIVRSRGIDWLRRRKASPAVPFRPGFSEGGDPSQDEPSAPPAQGASPPPALREQGLEAIGNLPPEDRTVVTLKHMEGLSYKEIADLTGSSVAAVESRLFRARKALRGVLERILR